MAKSITKSPTKPQAMPIAEPDPTPPPATSSKKDAPKPLSGILGLIIAIVGAGTAFSVNWWLKQQPFR